MSLKNLSVDFAFYGMLDLLQRSVSLVMVPLYTRALTQSEYGDLDMLLIASTVFLVLVDLQFVAGFSRLYLEYRSAGRGARFTGTVVAARLVGGCAIPLMFVAAGMLGYAEFRFLPSFAGHRGAWVLALTLVPPSLVYDILLLQARMLRWKKAFAVGALSNTVVSGVLSVLFVTAWKWGIAGVVFGLLVGKLVGLVLLVWDLRGEVRLCLDREILKPLAKYALPLVPGWWAAFGSTYIGRFFIYGVQGADQNAILAVCTKIVSVIGLYSVSFRSAWYPLAMSYIGDASGEAFYVKSMRLFMAGGLFSICCLAACLQLLLRILAPGSYGVVEAYFPLFAVGTLIAECESNLQLGNQIARRTHWISVSAVVYVAVNLAILIVFTGPLGIFAVGLGLGVSSLAKAIVTYVTSQRSCRIPYDTRSFALMGLGCALLLLFGALLRGGPIPGWTLRLAMAAVGIVIPWLMLEPFGRRLVKAIASGGLAGVFEKV